MTNRPRQIGECYTNFGLKHTSKSQNTIPDDVRFFRYVCLTPKEKSNLPTNCSFIGGTLSHEVLQESLCENKKVGDVIASEKFKEKVEKYEPINEKDKIKFEHIIKNMSALTMNHLTNIASLPSQKWENEKEYTHWDQRIKTYFLAYVDLIGETHFGDIKNVFGTLVKTKSGYSYTKKKCPKVPFHSDCLQIALYSKLLPKHIPFLTYASDSDHIIFTPDNCIELRKENLEKYYDELILYQMCWEKKLELANGDIKTLALLCKPDFSEIRKNGFWWNGIEPDLIERFRGYYE